MENSETKIYPNNSIDDAANVMMSAKQILTNFPNSNTKHIDYVIIYEAFTEFDLMKKENYLIHTIREEFFNQLKKDAFDIYYIEQEVHQDNENRKKLIYALLNCSNERLLQEAENIRLEMKLKHVCNFLENF
jgi:hypothetical protein